MGKVLRYAHRKRDAFSLSLYLLSHQGSTPSLPNFVTYPLCFLTAYKMTSHPSILAWASDSKKTRPMLLWFFWFLKNTILFKFIVWKSLQFFNITFSSFTFYLFFQFFCKIIKIIIWYLIFWVAEFFTFHPFLSVFRFKVFL